MSNPLMQFMGGGMMPGLPGPLGNIANVIQQFQQFRAAFQGDPKQQVERLRKSGQMSDEQYQQLETLAKQIMPFLSK